ncbi:MAG: 50S ribosomal protein L25 [Candidatus Eremiobacteraeota bacterium]|nr:50S ribosomal protein L25 [Candidatus Eremiobacteraeota bacterium]MBV8720889.1 50S ribosomal protein L25 [Candidatus Eremiobacteraeota bacterium]
MAKNTQTLKLELREGPGTIGARKTRGQGRIPGVIYGHGEPPLAIAIEAKALGALLHAGRRNIIDVQLDGRTDTALVREVQLDPVTRRVLSVDFQRVSRSDVITAEVTIVTVGTPAGVRDQGGVMDLVTHEIEVRGPADKIPESIRVDVSELTIGHHINAGELAIPEGLRLITPADSTIVAVAAPRAEEEAPAAAELPEGAEPAAEGAPAEGETSEAGATTS